MPLPKTMVVLAGIGALLLFVGLGTSPVWDDEIVAALYGRTILEHGTPIADIGLNHITLDNDERGRVVGPTWLQYYVGALTQRIAPKSEFALRFPFALAGLTCIVLTYILGRQWFHNDRAAFLGAILLTLNLTFLLHMRTARYYAFAVLFTLTLLLSLPGMLRSEKRHIIGFIVSSSLIFYTSPLAFLSVMPGIGTVIIILQAHSLSWRSIIRPVLIVGFFTGLLILPWTVWSGQADPGWALDNTLDNMTQYIVKSIRYIIPIPLLLCAIGLLLHPPATRRRTIFMVAALLVSLVTITNALLLENALNTVAAALTLVAGLAVAYSMTKAPNNHGPGMLLAFSIATIIAVSIAGGDLHDIRYLLPVMPALMLVTGWVIATTVQSARGQGLIVVALILGLHASISLVPAQAILSLPLTWPSCQVCGFTVDVLEGNGAHSVERVAGRALKNAVGMDDFVLASIEDLHFVTMFYTNALASPHQGASVPPPTWLVTLDRPLCLTFVSSIGAVQVQPSRYTLVATLPAIYYGLAAHPDPDLHITTLRKTNVRLYRRTTSDSNAIDPACETYIPLLDDALIPAQSNTTNIYRYDQNGRVRLMTTILIFILLVGIAHAWFNRRKRSPA